MKKFLLFIVLQVLLLGAAWAASPITITAVPGYDLPAQVSQPQIYSLKYRLTNTFTVQSTPYKLTILGAPGVSISPTGTGGTTCAIGSTAQLVANGTCDIGISFDTSSLPTGLYQQTVLTMKTISQGDTPLIFTTTINPPSDIPVYTQINGLPDGVTVNVSATDGTHSYGPHAQSNGTQSFDNMVPSSYTVTAPDYSSGGYTYVPTISNPYTVDSTHQTIAITYTPEVNPVAVTTNITGLPGGAAVNISATDGTHSYGPHAQSNGTQAFDSMLPGSYTVTAPDYSIGGVTYVPTVSNPYQIDSTHTMITIIYESQSVAVSTDIIGLLGGGTVTISATDGVHSYGPSAQSAGLQGFARMIPGSYTVSASTYTYDGYTFIPILSNPYTIDSAYDTIVISYQMQEKRSSR